MRDTNFSDIGLTFKKKISVAIRREVILTKLRDGSEPLTSPPSDKEQAFYQAMIDYERQACAAAQLAYNNMVATGLIK